MKNMICLKCKHCVEVYPVKLLEFSASDKKGISAYNRYVGVGVLAFNLHKIGNFLIQEERKIKKAA